MHIRALTLRDFRSWEHAEIELSTGPSVFLGANGNGKTNLLEALGYLSTLGSHRVAADAPLIRTGAERSRIGANVVHLGRELRIDVELNRGAANRAQINRSPVRRPREILGILHTVLFAPEDLALVRGDPGERRRFLDDLCTARRPGLAGVRADYDRVLRQRAALLKTAGRSGRAELGTLDVWDGHLAGHAAVLLAERLRLVHDLHPYLSSAYTALAPESRPATIGYRSASLPDELLDPLRSPEPGDIAVLEETLLRAVAAARTKELERGICLVGPHRDDLELMLGETLAKGFASHGESWSFALALRLAAFELLRAGGTEPVLLLDDVFAELDRRRRTALARVAGEAEQVLITAAVSEDVPVELTGAVLRVATTGDPEHRSSRLEPGRSGTAPHPAGVPPEPVCGESPARWTRTDSHLA